MFTRKIAIIIAAGTFLGAGAVQAASLFPPANSVFPAAADESSESVIPQYRSQAGASSVRMANVGSAKNMIEKDTDAGYTGSVFPPAADND